MFDHWLNKAWDDIYALEYSIEIKNDVHLGKCS